MLARRLGLLFWGAVLVLAYQNCGNDSQRVQFSEASKTPSIKNDSGYPYDGKLFFLIGDVCSDGTRIQGRIKLKDAENASLERRECQEITPQPLTNADFQLVANNPEQLTFKNEIFSVQLIGTRIDLTKVRSETGIAFWTPLGYDFGTSLWDTEIAPTASTLQLYEDGKLLGPAHTQHELIRNVGLGRYSHWLGHLYFSASDNTNPLTNGRVYTYVVP